MKYCMCGKKIVTCGMGLAFLFFAESTRAQQPFAAKWSGYVGDDFYSDALYAVAVDCQTNIYVGGTLGDGTIRNDQEIYPINQANGQDGTVAKLSADGSLLWYTDLGDQNDGDSVQGVALGTNGTLYAAGTVSRYSTLGDDSGFDALIASVGCDDGQIAAGWPRRIGATGTTNGFNAVAVDSNGCIYAAGYTSYSNLDNRVSGFQINGTTYGAQYKGGTDACIVKFNPDGSTVWSCYLGGANRDAATACAVASDGSVYVGGQTCSPGWASLGAGTPSASNPDAFVAKLTPAGALVWSLFFSGSASDAIAALVRDPTSDALYLGGSTTSSDFLSGASRLNSFAGGTDGFVVKLTDLGATVQTNWCRFFGSATNDSVSSLTRLTDGRIAVGGTTAAGSWLPQSVSSFSGAQDGYVSILNSDGSPSWASYVGGSRQDALWALAPLSNTLVTVGETYSEGWVSGGFNDTWTKSTNLEDVVYGVPLSYGFVVKWSSEPGVPPAVTDDPDDLTVNEGAPASFQISATGSTPLTYRWLRNGSVVTGASSNAYVIAAVAATNDNDTYCCLVSNYYGVATSQVARLTVIAKGTLTVTLSPAQAIAQGAVWSVTGGTNWFAGGTGTNLPPGTYTVTFTNLPGWVAPDACSVQVQSGQTTSTSGAYAAILPSAARTISGTNVSVTVCAPAGLSQWTLTETLSDALTPTAYTPGGAWNSGNHTLTFTGTEATTNTLSYTVSCATSGTYTVSGTVTPSPANIIVAVTGDSQIVHANLRRIISGTNVTIVVTQPSATLRWRVYEYIPSGLAYGNVTGPGITAYDDEIDWSDKSVGTNLTYVVSGAPGTYTLSGNGLVNNAQENIFGDSVVTIPDPNGGAETNVPPPTILAFVPVNGTTFALTFTSVVNQAYAILTNASAANTNGWATYLSLSGQAGTTQQQVPMGGSNLFYRVRTK